MSYCKNLDCDNGVAKGKLFCKSCLETELGSSNPTVDPEYDDHYTSGKDEEGKTIS